MPTATYKIYNVALIGCGDVAQLIHLPTISLMSHMFKATAFCDVSEQALKWCSEKFHVTKTYTNVDKLLDEGSDIDLVMVLNANEFHTIHAVKALEAGKDVFIEKPMTLTHVDVATIEAARVKFGRFVFVGYMRRFATAFLRAKEVVHSMDKIEYVRVRDIIGSNILFTEQSGMFANKFSDIPQTVADERAVLAKRQYALALGDNADNVDDQNTWQRLGVLASHDFSCMRELLGMPSKCLMATRSKNGKWITATFQYPGFVAYYETGGDFVRRFDAHITVYGDDKEVTVTYDTPFVKGLPITSNILSSKANGDHSVETIRPTYEDAYTLEYKELYDCLASRREPKTGPLDSDEDLKLYDMMMNVMVG